jgi:DNA-binding MarR family transcriptional regulator
MAKANATHELDAPPWLRVESTLMATARTIRQAYDERFEPLGLNLSQASMLAFLNDFGPHTQTRLAERLHLGRAATGTMIDQMEDRGLVGREPDPTDRRVWNVSITAQGRAVCDEVSEIDSKLRGELREGISRSERQLLASLLVRLQQNLANGNGSNEK